MLTLAIPYALLALNAFAAASLLPIGSEPLFIAMLLTERFSVVWLWICASIGNTAGSVFTWWLARAALRFRVHRWFAVKDTQLERATRWFTRYGRWVLLFAWVPIIGDPLCFVAGLARVRLLEFIILVGIGKGLRFWFVAWVVLV